MSAPPMPETWVGECDEATRRAVRAAVTAGVRRALAARGQARPAAPAAGPGGDGPWGADPGGRTWTMPGYGDGTGAPVAVPIRAAARTERFPFGDVLVRDRFPTLPVIRLAVDEWVRTGADPYVTSAALARAAQWGVYLYGAQGFTVLERRGRHREDRFVMVPLADPLLIRQFGRAMPLPAGAGVEATPGLQVTERGKVLELTDYRVVMTVTADDRYILDLGPATPWTPAAVRREFERTPPGERLDPAVAARVATAWLSAAGGEAEPGAPDEQAMLQHIVTMDRDVFAWMPWERRAGYLVVLSGLKWPSDREKKAIIELLASARSGTELEAMAALLRAKDAYRRLFTTLDGSVVELLLILGRTRPRKGLSPAYVTALFRELELLPDEPPAAPDPARRLRNRANGLSLWLRSTIDGIKDLFTHSPADLFEGLGHLAEFALLVHRATTPPPDPKAAQTLEVLCEQAGDAIRVAMAGLEYAERLGAPHGAPGGGARIAGDLADVLRTALAVEILSWFIGIGEIKEALGAAELTDRLAALLRVLASLRRLGRAGEVAQELSRLDRFVAALTSLARLQDATAAAQALRLLPQHHLAEAVRLAELLDVPAGTKGAALRRLARSRDVLPEVDRLADALSLARRFERRMGSRGGVTEDMTAALARLLETRLERRVLADMVDRVPSARLDEWSRAVSRMRPEHIERLGTDRVKALAYWPRAMSFITEAGGDVYVTLLRRAGGDARAVDGLLHAVELRRAELPDPAAYQRLLDRLAAGEAAAFEELAGRLSRAAEAARGRIAGRRHIMAVLTEYEEGAAELRKRGQAAQAAERLAEAERFAAQVGELTDRELSGLEEIARLAEDIGFDWVDALELPRADRAHLLTLVDDIFRRLPRDRVTGMGEVLLGVLGPEGGWRQFQGGWGELYAARTLVEDFGATALDFQKPRPNRVVDIVADLPGRGRVSAEVKTNITGSGRVVAEQLVKDLVAHAPTGYADLLYLYHPNKAGELPEIRQRMLGICDSAEAAQALAAAGHDPAAARAAFRAWLDAGNPRVYRIDP
ncbi:hypothetical protein [Bailinhaonella thermotolerans]|uniref:hypothetical protein n=1 Tax=Bailinhaonella thermotolerans TaxID=1070861 RepID=UPI00192A41E9|nr:hypothetical protein [Bailinhaonella thermotolerans]